MCVLYMGRRRRKERKWCPQHTHTRRHAHTHTHFHQTRESGGGMQISVWKWLGKKQKPIFSFCVWAAAQSPTNLSVTSPLLNTHTHTHHHHQAFQKTQGLKAEALNCSDGKSGRLNAPFTMTLAHTGWQIKTFHSSQFISDIQKPEILP